eukprot:CAMPEP_0201527706 /NCGR_PEP_ID=MMETSP0161_2-20130828/36040_1 /ASSEMBLY_ACC=CAM_ASM_000251 /TAXON_ID=180227 /ORGANISM="Neoparamoeba aestuarina, Strain SoJaBio B1-5/56/2" /LENGTH=273 /DNA_ID=CAMNT_0047928637 /DNA_START=392 /DNA_END=1212 /DNA_ORIENTATION=+
MPSTISLFAYFFLPESPRFLLLKGKTAEAKAIFRDASRKNGRPLPVEFSVQVPARRHQSTIATLTGNPTLRRLTVLLAIIWFSSSLAYYGIVFLASQLSFTTHDKYVSMLIVSLAELPAYCLTFLFSWKLGRTRGMAISSGVTILSMSLLAFQKHLPWNFLLACTFIARGGLAVFFSLTALFTPEAFPTVVRSSGFGLTSAFARLAGSLTPFIAISLNAMSVVAASAVYVGGALSWVYLCTVTAIRYEEETAQGLHNAEADVLTMSVDKGKDG